MIHNAQCHEFNDFSGTIHWGTSNPRCGNLKLCGIRDTSRYVVYFFKLKNDSWNKKCGGIKILLREKRLGLEIHNKRCFRANIAESLEELPRRKVEEAKKGLRLRIQNSFLKGWSIVAGAFSPSKKWEFRTVHDRLNSLGKHLETPKG